MAQIEASQIRDIGIPVRSVNWVQLHPGHDQDGAPCLYATMGQQADNLFVLQIELETGPAVSLFQRCRNQTTPQQH